MDGLTMRSRKEIQAGDESTNILDSENVTVNNTQHYGLSYADAKEAALDVFKNNFYELSGEAASTAVKRVEEFTEKLLKKMQEDQENLLNSFKDPDVQYGLFEAQKSFARMGNNEMEDLLVNLLIERTKIKDESFAKIVLNEALTIIPKLTSKQIDTLTTIYLFKYLNFKPGFKIDFDHYLQFLSPFIVNEDLSNSEMFYRHLQYSGCLSLGTGSSYYGAIMSNKFQHLNAQDIEGYTNSHPELIAFRTQWDTTKLCNTDLTSVGLVIAMTNANERLGTNWSYDIWINE